ncbi:nucleotidyltransferase domain-containing protein [Thermodesulfatator atlanticus]|uniref:nucleotidyltransferase domain-containing protein n=1 Tax=Thermodesulfatator atlanticus TaxID=501497 RepID=UPI0003B4D351|nr:nucleotidyltransferase domain-containing protein [Thermodesulfatator atlanticus]
MSRADKRLKEICDFLVRRLDPEKIFLIGSRAKGQARKGSDFDLVLVCPPLSFREERKLLEKLDEVAGIYSVDLLFWNKLSPEFKKVVTEMGEIIYEKDRSLSSSGETEKGF